MNRSLLLLSLLSLLPSQLLAHGSHPPVEAPAIHGLWHAWPLVAVLVALVGISLVCYRNTLLPLVVPTRRKDSDTTNR